MKIILNKKWDIFEKSLDFVLRVCLIAAILVINDIYFKGNFWSYIIIAIPVCILGSIFETFILSIIKNSKFLSKPFRDN